MILIKTTVYEKRPLDVVRDAWRDICRNAHQAMGEHWHQNILPDHFTEKARYRYRHKLRSFRYRLRKERLAAAGKPYAKGGAPILMGGKVDNVLTGYMQKQLESSKTIQAFPSRVTIKMFGPRYITMRAYKKDGPDKGKEITTVTNDQRKELAKVFQTSIDDQLASYRQQRRTEI